MKALSGNDSKAKERAVKSMLEIAKHNFTPALYLVGMWELKGENVIQDIADGNAKIRKAADKDYGPAIYEIASRSIDNPNESAKAWDNMRKASMLGSAQAQFFLGDHYQRGVGVGMDLESAKSYFRLCAARGQGACQYRLAKLLFDNPSRPDYEYEQALAWFKLAADNK